VPQAIQQLGDAVDDLDAGWSIVEARSEPIGSVMGHEG
jgi:hypothetical protein